MPADEGKAPHGPEKPGLDFFLSGTIDPQKLANYTLSPLHPSGQHKARLWKSVFGWTREDAALLADYLMAMLAQVEHIEEREVKAHDEDPSRLTRRWRLDIPRFEGLNGNVARVRTEWALDPDKDRPHLSTAYPKLKK